MAVIKKTVMTQYYKFLISFYRGPWSLITTLFFFHWAWSFELWLEEEELIVIAVAERGM